MHVIATLTPAQQSWLTDPSSLTKRLREFTHNAITHHLFFNDWDEKKENWIRKMEWRYHGATWVACVVTIPKNSLMDELKTVGARSIGEILFSEPSLTRSEFVFEKQDDHIARHSVFHFKQKPIYLTENFTPEFFYALETLF